jgi:hypothetical protein
MAAILGLAASVEPSESFCGEALRENGFSLTDAIESLESVYEAHGYPEPPRVQDGKVRVSI